MTTLKSIDWSYATSPNADKFKFPKGCYTVSLRDGKNCLPRSVAGFAELEAAFTYADSLPFQWHFCTIKRPEQKLPPQ